MSNGYIITVDPAELANRFPSMRDNPEERYLAMESGIDPDSAEEPLFSPSAFETRVQPLLCRIPKREADYIQLYYIQKKRQSDIAQIFGVTQAAVSYRLSRGVHRLRFLLALPQITSEGIREDLPSVPFTSVDIDILVGMWETTCQTEVAAKLTLTQGKVRHRFFAAVETLAEAAKRNPKYEPYAKVFKAISSKKFCILHGVNLPQWSNRGGDGCY